MSSCCWGQPHDPPKVPTSPNAAQHFQASCFAPFLAPIESHRFPALVSNPFPSFFP